MKNDGCPSNLPQKSAKHLDLRWSTSGFMAIFGTFLTPSRWTNVGFRRRSTRSWRRMVGHPRRPTRRRAPTTRPGKRRQSRRCRRRRGGKPGDGSLEWDIYTYVHTHTHIYIYICIWHIWYIYIYVRVNTLKPERSWISKPARHIFQTSMVSSSQPHRGAACLNSSRCDLCAGWYVEPPCNLQETRFSCWAQKGTWQWTIHIFIYI